MSQLRAHGAAFLIFAALTAVVTYPQILYVATSVPFHSDPYFSMWRLAWVAHQIVRDPHHLFEANIFFPEHDTLAFSDAMLLPGLVLSPLFWSRVNPVAVYNITLFVAFALSGLTTWMLARRLTGSGWAGLIAGTIFAFAPYRFTHYMHLELQFVFWMPLGLLLIHRIAESRRLRDGLLLGLVMAGLALSTVYGAIFFATYCAVFAPVLYMASRPVSLKKPLLALVLAAAVAAVIAAPYGAAYHRAERSVGSRSIAEIQRYSPSIQNYFQAPDINRLYGSTAETDPIWANELNLFPGLVALTLAAIGLLPRAPRMRFVYLAALLFAFDFSRGLNGLTYPVLYRYVSPFRGLRSPARIDILVNLSLAILAGYGVTWLLARINTRLWRQLVPAAILALLVVEYASLPQLEPAPLPSPVDAWLARQPPLVIVELPLQSRSEERQSRDWIYQFQGINHEQKMLNGYSGFAPPSYYAMLDAMEGFPDDRSMALLRERHVDYVIVRGWRYKEGLWPLVSARMGARPDLVRVVTFSPKTQPEAIYAVREAVTAPVQAPVPASTVTYPRARRRESR